MNVIEVKRLSEEEDKEVLETRRILDFAPGKVTLGAVSPDLLGKATCAALARRMGLHCEPLWRQNRTGHDANMELEGKRVRVEVKWSAIQVQLLKEGNKNPRFEFGNIDRTKFDVLLLFAHHALLTFDDDELAATVKKNLDERLVWSPDGEDDDQWLRSCWVWVIESQRVKTTSLHCNVAYPRGPYKAKEDGISLWPERVHGGEYEKIKAKFVLLLNKL